MRLICILLSTLLLLSCSESTDESPVPNYEPLQPAPVSLSRLTQAQYKNAVTALLGSPLALPSTLEPDVSLGGLPAAGASVTTISPRGAELYEEAARSLANQAMQNPELQKALLPCSPAGVSDTDCMTQFVQSFGPQAWRRPITQDEVAAMVSIGDQAAATMEDFNQGVVYVIAAFLQSPHFLYRVERGEADPNNPGQRRYSSIEMASRLSFFLWNSIPDGELLAAAHSGDLVDDNALLAQIQRMIAGPRLRSALRNFFSEWLHLASLKEMKKDPLIFKHYSSDLGEMAREETLRLVEHLFVDGDADFRDFFTSRTTFVNRRLAALYNVPATVPKGFGQIQLPASEQRRGFLGQVSFLGLHSHPVSSSATLRGAFLRQAIMCDPVPPPPADLNTALPEPDKDAKTLKERLIVHMEAPFCASCHEMTDIPGFGFENFDGVGRFRLTDNDAIIDPSGHLDGDPFADFSELATAVANSPRVSRCFVQKMYSYAVGRPPGPGDKGEIDRLNTAFEGGGRKLKALLVDMAMSDGFRRAGEVQ
ncbi:MAG TPA: DUF1592 domain-containing protein [Myxococcales bacterium]|nr:DUF1592 domain-containing protein [Myxococcales bacterium]